jgi:hypothetical protein
MITTNLMMKVYVHVSIQNWNAMIVRSNRQVDNRGDQRSQSIRRSCSSFVQQLFQIDSGHRWRIQSKCILQLNLSADRMQSKLLLQIAGNNFVRDVGVGRVRLVGIRSKHRSNTCEAGQIRLQQEVVSGLRELRSMIVCVQNAYVDHSPIVIRSADSTSIVAHFDDQIVHVSLLSIQISERGECQQTGLSIQVQTAGWITIEGVELILCYLYE